jgi:hypothetical protein
VISFRTLGESLDGISFYSKHLLWEIIKKNALTHLNGKDKISISVAHRNNHTK